MCRRRLILLFTVNDVRNYKGKESRRQMRKMDSEGVRNLIECCQPLLLINRMTGINIYFSRKTESRCERICSWFYVILLLLICVWCVGIQLYPVLSQGISRDLLWYLNCNDHFIILAVLYLAVIKRQDIQHTCVNILKISAEFVSEGEREVRARVARWKWLALGIIVTSFLSNLPHVIVDYFIPLLSDDHFYLDYDYFEKDYLGIKGAEDWLIKTMVFMTEVLFVFIVLCADIFAAFVMILCCLLKESYQQLNKNLTATRIHFVGYKKKHQQITRLVASFNDNFSPAVAIMLLLQMYQIIASTDDIRMAVQQQFTFVLTFRFAYKMMKTSAQFVAFVYIGQQIRSQAQNGVTVLMDACLSHGSEDEEEERPHKHKECRLSTLFTAQLIISPVVITASGLFDVDIKLITLVISVAITFFTIISTLKAEDPSSTLAPSANRSRTT